jgi:hypothetical protein
LGFGVSSSAVYTLLGSSSSFSSFYLNLEVNLLMKPSFGSAYSLLLSSTGGYAGAGAAAVGSSFETTSSITYATILSLSDSFFSDSADFDSS